MGVPCVFSNEPPVLPRPDGTVCDLAGEPATREADVMDEPVRRLGCDWGYGSATFVTGAFGFAAAGWVVGQIARAPEGRE